LLLALVERRRARLAQKLACEYHRQDGTTTYSICDYYVKAVLWTLIPLLTNALKQQKEDQDEDSWNFAMAAATCLASVAKTMGDEVVPRIMSFITANMHSKRSGDYDVWIDSRWTRDNDNSTFSAPSSFQWVAYSLIIYWCVLLQRGLWDISVNSIVAVWMGSTLEPIMRLLLEGLQQEPRESHSICCAIHNIVKAFEETDESRHGVTVLDQLLSTSARGMQESAH
jgi:importin subunit beta-1